MTGLRLTPEQLAAYQQGREMAVPESDVLAACLQYANLHQRVAWAQRMNTGAWEIDEGQDDSGQRPGRFIRFGFPGLSDIVGQLKDGRWLAFETKRAGKKPTRGQLAFLALVNTHNGLAGWGGLEELEQLLKERSPWPTRRG